jgi:hypothetical protein
MKRFNFLSAVIALVLIVTAVSCTTMRGANDGYYDRAQASDRVYIDDPYRGTVVLERDPYTGRYYEINSYGSYSSPYGYRNRYDTRYNRNYTNRNRVYRNNNNNNNSNANQQQTEQQKKEWNQKREEARKKVLGN